MCTDSDILRCELSSIRERFLLALAEGGTTLNKFERRWSSLLSEVSAGIQEGRIQDDITQLAYNSATLIAAFGESLLSCEHSASSMMVNVENSLARLTLDETISSSSKPNHYRTLSTLPLHIPAAYEWLMENLHNPYPSIHTKQSLASRSGLTTREIHDWFKEVRRSIGWVAFCKKHFKGSRCLAVEAATRILSEEGMSSVSSEVEVDVLSLRGTAECLFLDHLVSSRSNPDWTPFLPPTCSTQYSILPYNAPISTPLSEVESPQVRLGSNNQQNTLPVNPWESYSLALPATKSFIPSPSRKRRLSDAGIEENRKKPKSLPGESRRQVVSDPLPFSSTLEPEGLDTLWMNLFNPTLPAVVTDTDISRPINIVSNEWCPPMNDGQLAELSTFWASVIPENEQQMSTPIALPGIVVSQDNTPPTALAHSQAFNGVLPFTDPTLEMDSTVAGGEGFEQFRSIFEPPENLFDFSSASLPDNSSDTSSIFMLSPPRTPTISPTIDLPTDNLPKPNDSLAFDFAGDSKTSMPSQPFELSSVLDTILYEKDNSAVYPLSLAGDFALLDSAYPTPPLNIPPFLVA